MARTESKPTLSVVAESFAARQARHAEARAELDRVRDSEVERGRAIVSAAQDRYHVAMPALQAEQKREILEAKISMQRLAAEKLAPTVAAFIDQPSRATARAVAIVFQELEAESVLSTGAELMADELAHAFASAMVDADPDCLPKFALLDAYYGYTSLAEESYAAARACRMTGSTSAGLVEDSLRALEAKAARIAETGSRANATHAAAFFDAIRFSGGPNEAAQAIAEIERSDREAAAHAACEVSRKHKGWSILNGLSGLVEKIS